MALPQHGRKFLCIHISSIHHIYPLLVEEVVMAYNLWTAIIVCMLLFVANLKCKAKVFVSLRSSRSVIDLYKRKRKIIVTAIPTSPSIPLAFATWKCDRKLANTIPNLPQNSEGDSRCQKNDEIYGFPSVRLRIKRLI